MRRCWEVLRSAGVPDGAIRRLSEGTMEPASIAAALAEVVADVDGLGSVERECLGAWLAAFRHHWPDRFASILGRTGDHALHCLGAPPDPGRYLKLRRIAIENLAALI
jgi:hypothetical protein